MEQVSESQPLTTNLQFRKATPAGSEQGKTRVKKAIKILQCCQKPAGLSEKMKYQIFKSFENHYFHIK